MSLRVAGICFLSMSIVAHAGIDPPSDRFALAWPDAPSSGLNRSWVLDFADSRSAVMVLAGPNLRVYFDAATRDQGVLVSSQVVDACVLRGAPSGGDAIVVLEGNQISIITYVPATGELMETLPLALSGVVAPVAIRAGAFGNTGFDGLLVVDAPSGSPITLRAFARTTSALAFTAAGSAPINPAFGPVHDAVAFDFDGNPSTQLQVAAMTDDGVSAYDLTAGSMVFRHRTTVPGTSTAIAKVHLVSGHDGVAWVRKQGNKQVLDFLSLFGADDPPGTIQPTMPSPRCIALASGDRDHDGDDDLLIAFENSATLHYVANQSTGLGSPAFPGYHAGSHPESAKIVMCDELEETYLSSAPCFGSIFRNLTASGALTLDVALPVAGSGLIALHELAAVPLAYDEVLYEGAIQPSQAYPNFAYPPRMSDHPVWSGAACYGPNSFVPPTPGEFIHRIAVKNVWPELDVNSIESVVWKQASAAGNLDSTVRNVAVSHEFHDAASASSFDATTPIYLDVRIPNPVNETIDFAFFDNIYYVEIRAHGTTATGAQRAGRSYLLGLSMQELAYDPSGSNNTDYLRNLVSPTAAILAPWCAYADCDSYECFLPLPPGVHMGAVYTGTASVPIPQMPPMSNTSPPSIPVAPSQAKPVNSTPPCPSGS